MRAVDEDQFFAHQRFRTGIGQGIEEQCCIGTGGVRVVRDRAVKQLVGKYVALVIHDGLAGDAGDIGVIALGSGGDLGGGVHSCGEFGGQV